MNKNFSNMNSTVVLNIVGLSQNTLSRMPKLFEYSQKKICRQIQPVFPALTCSAQSTYLTGTLPSQHGIVGNGWYFRDLSQVWLWRQSNHLVQSEKIWDQAKLLNSNFTCANLFWWYNMYSNVDFSVTPRPLYRSDGQKLPDIYSFPSELRHSLQDDLGTFPLFQFWGPGANLKSSNWIARASQKVFLQRNPTLSLVYLPHLDYCLQKLGPHHPDIQKELTEFDSLCMNLIEFYQSQGVKVIVLSEYGIEEVKHAIPINQIFRRKGWLSVHQECGEDHFDAGASQVFAIADHQISHVYVNNKELLQAVKKELLQNPGIEKVLDKNQQIEVGISHERSGDLIAIAATGYWFSYRFWLDDDYAPDFARTVDIHKKPGYDPVELFLDPKIRFPKLAIAQKLISKKLGFRTTMDLIPLDDSLVKGSHGRAEVFKEYQPLCIFEPSCDFSEKKAEFHPTQIRDLIMDHVFAE